MHFILSVRICNFWAELYPICIMTLAQCTIKSYCWAVYEAHTVKIPAQWYLMTASAGQPRQCLMGDCNSAVVLCGCALYSQTEKPIPRSQPFIATV